MSLDKVESSSPILTAAHAGGEHGENWAPATKCFGCRRYRRAVVLRFPDSLPTFEYSPSRGKSPLCFAKQPFLEGTFLREYKTTPSCSQGIHTVLQGRRCPDGAGGDLRCLIGNRGFVHTLLSPHPLRQTILRSSAVNVVFFDACARSGGWQGPQA